MQTIRRLYLYLLSGITLGMLAVGLSLLLEVTLAAIGVGHGALAGGGSGDRERLSIAAALVGVGLPVWAVHWLLVERGMRPASPHADAERASIVRALYFSFVLGVLLGFGAIAALALIGDLIRTVLGGPAPEFFASDPASSIAVLAVTGAAWFYHASIRRRDMRAGPLAGAAAWLPRVYLYGASLIGLGIMLLSLGSLVAFAAEALIGPPPDFVEPGYRAVQLAGHLAAVLVWGGVWLGHWWYAGRLVADAGWRGASERPANLRLAYFVAVIGISAFAVIWFVSRAASAVLVPLLGAAGALGGAAEGGDLLRAVIVSILSAVPWAIAWWLHVRWVRAESVEADNPDRAATVDRLDFGVVGLIGLGFGAVGAGWLLGLLVDAALGGNRTIGDGWRLELAQYLPWSVLGFVAWAWNWAKLQRRHAADPVGEAGSTVRRSYLLIVVAAAILSSLGSLALVLYRLFGELLGASLSGSAVSELSTPIGALLVAAAVAIYHGVTLRRDMALRAGAEPELAQPEAPAEAPAPAPYAGERQRTLVLSAPPEGELDAAVEALRAHLPTGYRLEELSS
ncbi:MAG TPA: DUF5671 domain-containing protein [Candidatus Limnocylindria bacterium]